MNGIAIRPPDLYPRLPAALGDDGLVADVVVGVDLGEDGVQVHKAALGRHAHPHDVLHDPLFEEHVGQLSDAVRITAFTIPNQQVITS